MFIACEKGPNFREFDYPAPVVNDFSPKQGYIGSAVSIEGKDFGTTLKAVKVYFGGVLADSIQSVEDNKIVVMAPQTGVTGKLKVEIYGKADTTAQDFIYMPSARIVSANTDKAQIGDEIILTGENFGEDQTKVKVYIGEVEGTVTAVGATEIKFTVPDAPSGNIILLVDGQHLVGPYLMVGIEKLTGTLIGHSGSWSNNPATTISAAVDGDITTAVDAPSKTGFVGYDLGAGKAGILKSIRYVPRTGNEKRMVGGEIRGANDPSLTDYVVLHTVAATPPSGVYSEAAVETEESYRYIYYYSPDGYCNIAEIEFYGNIVEQEVPKGKLIWEFNADGNNEGWEPQQSGTWTVSGGTMQVKFTQTSGNKRADLKQTMLPVTIHTGNYPIFAIKMDKPAGARITFDTNNGSFGNGYNKYATDYESKNVYYWDMSTLSMGTGGARPDEEISLTTFQLKIADIPQTDPATGYTVQWIRTFASKEELASFLENE